MQEKTAWVLASGLAALESTDIATINIAATRCQLTLTTTSPPTAASIITTTTVIIIATEITTEPFEAPLTSGVTKRYASTIGD
jgi:hypothetical protein